MRLTLRTLLAYLDDVLPPADTELLHKRIAESEFASTLVQRMRHALKRLRLNAPKVDGKGIGFDANSVAEYLDSTLAPDRMTEFERVCLESDVHLAEVAACHQILCKVLKEPAQVSEPLKARIHSLEERLKQGTLQPPAYAIEPQLPEIPQAALVVADDEEPALAAKEMTPKPHPKSAKAPEYMALERQPLEVPDYLKPEPSQSRWQLLSVLGIMAAVAVVFLIMSPIGKQFFGSSETKQVVATNENTSLPPVPDSPAINDAKKTEITENTTVPDNENGEKNSITEPKIETPEKTKTPEIKPPNDTPKLEPKEEEPKEKTVEPDKNAPPLPEMKPEDVAEKTKPTPMEETTPPMEQPLGEVGKLSSDESLLARFDVASSSWARIPTRGKVMASEVLISLPGYRPQILLSNGMLLTCGGESSFRFQRGSQQPLALQAEFGKFLFVSSGGANSVLELDLQGIRGELILPTVDSEAAVELTSYLPPGEDPALTEPLAVLSIYASQGSVIWKPAKADAMTLLPQQACAWIIGKEPVVRDAIRAPDWLTPQTASSPEREAAKTMDSFLTTDRPLVLSLTELASQRRIEVRTLVARCLFHLGQPQQALKILGNEEYRAFWPVIIETLHSQIDRGGENAVTLLHDLIKIRGEKDGQLLYRLLSGYNSEQLVNGAAKDLVEYLENQQLDIRLLAFDNLKRITNNTTYSYQPASTPDKNRPALVRWERAQKEGEIVYATEPSPYPLWQSLVEKAPEKSEK